MAVRRRTAHVFVAGIIVAVSGCSSADGIDASASGTQSPSPKTAAPSAVVTPSRIPVVAFSTQPFAEIDPNPLDAETAADLQRVLADLSNGGGVTATVMTGSGTWSGASGTADGIADLQVESQFGIASVTKSIIASQVMQLVETRELSLDAPVSNFLPTELRFDTNGATIRQLLSHRSGIPDWYSDAVERQMSMERSRVWELPEVLDLAGSTRGPTDRSFGYADTNYTLLGLAIEHVRGEPLVEVLREGVLDVEGTERLIYQPAEAPTDPMAMPRGRSRSAFEEGGGYLPSISDASSAGAAGAMASDSLSLARWWRAFCAGEIISQESLTVMATFYDGVDGYGLGVFNPADGYGQGIGHLGSNFGYTSWAACLTDKEAVVVVLTTQAVDDQGGLARPLVDIIGR